MRTRQPGICSTDSVFSCVVILNIVQFSQLPNKIQVALLRPSGDTRNAFGQSRNLAYSAKICTLCTPRKRKLNPFTATACKISGLKDTGTRLKRYIFRSCNISFQCCVSIKILLHDSVKNTTETVTGFKFCTFIGRLQMTSRQ